MFPSPHIVAALGLPLLCALCFALGRLTRPKRRGLYLRRGGYIHFLPHASDSESPKTVWRRRTSTAFKRGGLWQAEPDGRVTLHGASRTTAPTGSGASTGTTRGGLTTAAPGPGDVA